MRTYYDMGATKISCRGIGKAQFACSTSFIEDVTKGVLVKTKEEHLLKKFFFCLIFLISSFTFY